MRLGLVCLCVLGLMACDGGSLAGPTVPLNQEFTLSPGESAVVEGTSLRVQFLRVSGDSRCPADAVCIQGGDAIVHVHAVTSSSAGDYELHTGDRSHGRVSHDGFYIELAQLQPYPFSSRIIEPGAYRATLVVGR